MRMLLLFLAAWLSVTTAHNPQSSHDYVLVATGQNISTHCTSRYSVVFNGTNPAPPLYLKENMTTRIRVYNHIEGENLTVHWHGLSMRTSPFSDGTPSVSQWPIAPGSFFDYYVAPIVGDAGTYMYHSHVGFQANTATGMLIVQDQDGRSLPYQYDGDESLLFQDYFRSDDATITAKLLGNPFIWPGDPEAITINGFSGNASFTNASDASCSPYVLTVEPGLTYRFRFASNTGLSLVTMGIEEHENLTIIEADGEYTKPWETERIQIGSGQRFSVLLKTKTIEELETANKTQFWVRYESRDRPGNTTGYALLSYNIPDNMPSSELPQDLPTVSPVMLPMNVTTWAEYALEALNPAEPFPKLSEVTRTVTITTGQIIFDGSYVNGTAQGVVEWTQNTLPWQEHEREANREIPYLIQVYRTGQTPDYEAALQNRGWDPVSQAWPARVGEVLDIVWESNTGFTGNWDFHPMHAHGKHYFDLGSGNGTYDAVENEAHFVNYTPARRDTTMLHRYAASGEKEYTSGWRAWRIRITEEDVGAWMVHCHILQHMVMGMQTVWVYGDAEAILAKYPQPPYVDGYLEYGGDAYGNATYDPLVDGIYGSLESH